ncbi:MAG: leucine-rich repeat protein [Ruminococcus sp.]|nr:leucine-rich repeat protein [Ruminococcus sp.]
MKKIVALLLALMLGLSCAVPAFASDDASMSDWLYTVKNGEAVVTGYTGSDTELAVPSSLGGHTVTEIGTAAFYRSKIEKLSIPSTVRKIGWWAFYGSSRLSEVKLVRGLGTISFGAFLNCTSLREIELPPTVYSIGSDAFAVNCRTRTGIPDILNDRRVGEQYYCVNTSFVIKGCIGTAAEKYAADKKLVFSGSDTLTFGDVNSDGSINSKDIILVENYINGGRLSTPEKFNSDLDCDGSVGESDLELLRSYISGKISLYDIPANSFRMPEHSWLYGKKLYSDGDSVAKGTGTDTFGKDFHSYSYYLAEKYSMDFTTNAVGGTTLAKIKENPLSSGTSILERVLTMHEDYDVILLDGGFNDIFLKVKVGEVTPDSNKGGFYDVTTTAGALEQICYFLTKNYKDAVKLFVLCHDCDDRQPLYWDMLRKVLDKWEIPYVDICSETDFRAVNEEINKQYFYCNDDKDVGDEIHPVAYAQDKVYGANADIRDVLGFSHSLRAGVEVNLLPGMALRAGYSMTTGAQHNYLQWEYNPQDDKEHLMVYELSAAERAALVKHTVSAGLGFTHGAFFTDITFRYRSMPTQYFTPYEYYDYSGTDYTNKYVVTDAPYALPEICATYRRFDAILTLGMRF